MRNDTARNRFRFARSIQGDTPNLFCLGPVVNPILMGRTHRTLLRLSIHQLRGTGAVRVYAPNTNGIRAARKCPRKDEMFRPARRDTENSSCRIADKLAGVFPVRIASHDAGAICREQTTVERPMKMLDLRTV